MTFVSDETLRFFARLSLGNLEILGTISRDSCKQKKKSAIWAIGMVLHSS